MRKLIDSFGGWVWTRSPRLFLAIDLLGEVKRGKAAFSDQDPEHESERGRVQGLGGGSQQRRADSERMVSGGPAGEPERPGAEVCQRFRRHWPAGTPGGVGGAASDPAQCAFQASERPNRHG